MGELVALNCKKYNERPQLAEITEVFKTEVAVIWWDGSYTSNWKYYTYYIGRKAMKWEERISLADIILRNIKLTPSKRLSQKTIRQLKLIYK